MDAVSVIELDMLRELAQRLHTAQWGEQGRIMAEASGLFNLSASALYERLKRLGLYNKGRKRRSDAGALSLTEDETIKAGALLKLGIRANGKRTLSVNRAVELLHANGIGKVDQETGEIESISASTLARTLRAHHCHPDQLEAPHPALSMRSRHPNHVWQVDMSVCTLFYAPNGGIRGIEHLDDTELYKNKPDAMERVAKHLCIRWLVTDHCTDSYFVWYQAGTESAHTFIEFFIQAIQDRGEPFHGVPNILVMDPGAAARAATARNLLDRLGVKVIVHQPKNPRAKGGVEGGHNRWEMLFESRLALWYPPSIEALNERANLVRAAHCARALHSRHKMSRWSAWQRIMADQLRLAPSVVLCRELVTTAPVERTVTDQLFVSYAVPGMGSREYFLRHIPGIAPRQKVRVVVNTYRAPAIDVLITQDDGTDAVYTIEPEIMDEWGFRTSGNVWGEAIKALPETPAEKQLKRVYEAAYGVPTQQEADKARRARKNALEGEFDIFADAKNTTVPQYLPKRGTEHSVSVAARELPPVPLVEAVRRLKAAGDRSSGLYARMQADFPDGMVPASELERLEQQIRSAPMQPLQAVQG